MLGAAVCLLLSTFVVYVMFVNRWNPPKAELAFDRVSWIARPDERFLMWQSAAHEIQVRAQTLERTLDILGLPDTRWTNRSTVHLMYSLGSRSRFPLENAFGFKKHGDIDIWYLHTIYTNGVVLSCTLKAT